MSLSTGLPWPRREPHDLGATAADGEARADAARTDAARTDAARTDAARTDAARTDAARTDVGRTDVGRTDVGRADAGRTDVGRTDADAGRAARIHLGAWDQLRVIAAVDTVAIHLTGRHALYGFGLPLFLILAVALGVSKPEPAPTRTFVSRRFERVIAPWLFWSIVLFGARLAERAHYGRPLFDWLRPEMLLYGPEIHLWFLPFVVVAGLLVHQLVGLVPGWRADAPRVGWILGAFALGGLLLIPASSAARGWPFDQWLFSLPTLALGLGLGRCLALREHARVRRAATAGLAVFVGAGLLAVMLRPEASAYLVRYAGGLGLLVAGTWLPAGPRQFQAFTSRLVPAMLGVYVLHIEVHRHLGKPALQALGLYDERWLRVLVAFPLTLLAVLLLRRTPLRRFL